MSPAFPNMLFRKLDLFLSSGVWEWKFLLFWAYSKQLVSSLTTNKPSLGKFRLYTYYSINAGMHSKEILCTLNIREPSTEFTYFYKVGLSSFTFIELPTSNTCLPSKISNSCLSFSIYK